MKMKNSENVDRWRKNKGNDLRQKKYHYIRGLGVDSRKADSLKYKSVKNIIKYLFSNDIIDDTIKVSNELESLTNG